MLRAAWMGGKFEGVMVDRYKVRDIENDDVAIGTYEHCENIFDSYDINKVREAKKREFEKWLEEFTEA